MNQRAFSGFPSNEVDINPTNSFDVCGMIKLERLVSYQDIVPIKILKKGRFPILIGHAPQNTEEYLAVKLYPFVRDKQNPSFLNEARFVNLHHKNINSILYIQNEKEALFKDGTHKISYIVMELAPHGDFYDLMASKRDLFDEKLARTYFRQLIEGIKYLHKMKVAHLDLKLQNLFLGANFTLKIGDFDHAHRLESQTAILTRGSEGFRAPEIARERCQIPEAADIYSAGIILFVFKCKGVLPYLEKGKYKGIFTLMMTDPRLFWEKHHEMQKRDRLFFDEDFKELFMSMTAYRPEDRPNID